MTLDRRHLLGLLGSAGVVSSAPATAGPTGVDRQDHARFMRAAVDQARRNPRYPFGAVLVGSGRVLGRGLNTSAENPTYHGEMVAMADYVRRVGNHGWAAATLYSTGEPCAMCMSACAWAGVGQVVWGTSIDGLGRTGQVLLRPPAAGRRPRRDDGRAVPAGPDPAREPAGRGAVSRPCGAGCATAQVRTGFHAKVARSLFRSGGAC
ncbi:nucleoside deaminase [Streptomyces sp. NPDC048254]|uniref:nucleoside deaminase n=1 Tax=Streptomyces sp. NPDC048254 TaxID=3365525 RepID=UPI003716DA35